VKFLNNLKNILTQDETISNIEIAKKYLNEFYKYEPSGSIGGGDVGLDFTISLNERIKLKGPDPIAIANDNYSLNMLSKKLPFISDRVILSQTGNYSKINYLEYLYPGYDMYTTVSASCADLNGLGDWLRNNKELILNDKLIYVPSKITLTEIERGFAPATTNSEISFLTDLVLKGEFVSEISEKNFTEEKFIKPILTLNIPYLNNVDTKTFNKIVIDEEVQLSKLRNFLREKLLDISSKQDGFDYKSSLERIKISMEKGVNLITSDLKLLNKKRNLIAVSATISTAAATLLAVNSEVFKMWSTIAGTSGGAFLFFKLIESRIIDMHKLKDSPFYFLWLLHSKSK